MFEEKKQSQISLLIRNLIAVSCIFAVGFLLGSNSKESDRVPTPRTYNERLDESLIPAGLNLQNESRRILTEIELQEYDETDEDDFLNTCQFNIPIVDVDVDGNLYDEDMVNIDELADSFEATENHTFDEQFYEFEAILMAEESFDEPTLEEIDDPISFLNETDEEVEVLEYDRRLRMPQDNDHADGRDKERNLMDHEMFHVPLACNEGIEMKTCSNKFSSLVEKIGGQELLVIPCGECYFVDIEDNLSIDLPHGLSIEGKLYFPSTAHVTIRTKFVWVVGLLEIETPDVGKEIKFSLYGEDLHTFTAINQDSPLCSNGCNMGSKVIAVVGGRMDIKGDAENCPAWEKLTDLGDSTLRPFANHLPCMGSDCWTDEKIKIKGICKHSKGHSDKLGRYTVFCPIESKALIKHGTHEGIKLTSIESADSEFNYPQDKQGKALSLTLNGSCRNAKGHSTSMGRCVIFCPLQKTALIPYGSNGEPLIFTSVLPTSPIEMPPSTKNGQVELRLDRKCLNSGSHSRSYKKCVLACSLFRTHELTSGERSGKLLFTSKFRDDPVPFPFPRSKKMNMQVEEFTLGGQCKYKKGHSNAWDGCVVLCPVVTTASDLGAYHSAARLKNEENGKVVDVKRILQYANKGNNMYLLLQDVSKDQCGSDGAALLNDVFQKGDTIVPSYQIGGDESANGNEFEVDHILHYSFGGDLLYFSTPQTDLDRCDDVANDFSTKFPPGYEITIEHKDKAPGGETFPVDKVHHWAWGRKSLYFLPKKSDVKTCDSTVSDFNSKFKTNFQIDVSKEKPTATIGDEVEASQGVHHWSWGKKTLFFHPDVTVEEINRKFPVGTTVKVDFLTASDILDIKVSKEASKCWRPGTELLLTSHTRSFEDQQVRQIVSSDVKNSLLRLSSPIDKPITLADHEVFAVEVAPLNRRIVFEAEGDTMDENIGGHLIIHHTNAPQNIQGVEVRNFGQQGRLGRYPIHFHMCRDSRDSMVTKNVVRNSNQRCYVTHLTNMVTFKDNVAYDAVGHCYFIEDGGETGNTFHRNLGSGIRGMPSDKVAQLSKSSGRSETDDTSSVFWISNPQNNFLENVAAGGAGHGYWFETHGTRRHKSLGLFEDNEVHSSKAFAFTTYAPGWRPKEVAEIKNLKAYRNHAWGAFLHVTQNLHFNGGLFADNGSKSVMISRGDDLVFNDVTFIGQTEFSKKRCWGGESVGIHLDPVRLQETVIWNFLGDKKGSTVRNCRFLKYSPNDTSCTSANVTPLKFYSHQTFIKAYSAPHVFDDLTFGDDSYAVNAMMPGSGIDDVQVEIVSDRNGLFSAEKKPGFLIAEKLKAMIQTKCSDYKNGLKFCPDSCIRTVSVLAGNSAFVNDNIDMIIEDDDGREIKIKKDVRGHPDPQPEGNRFFAAYTVSLPKGKFKITFENALGTAWPRYAFVVLEAAPVSCKAYVEEFDFSFNMPTSSDRCNDLVLNGDFQRGLDGWYANHHPLEVQESEGVDGATAIVTTKKLNEGNTPSHSLDGSCVKAGDEYAVKLSYRFQDYDGSNNLPKVKISSKFFNSGNALDTYFTELAAEALNEDGWNTIRGRWKVNEDMAAADGYILSVVGGAHRIKISNVSMERIATDDSTSVRKRRVL